MTMLFPNDQKNIDAFFSAIEPFQGAYKNATFNYLAVKRGDDFQLVQGRLLFNTLPSKIPFTHFQSNNIRAGHYRLSELNLGARDLITSLLSGTISTPNGKLFFFGNDAGKFSVSYEPIHHEGVKLQCRLNVLTINGAPQTSDIGQPIFESIRQALFDWELRAAPTPYDGLQELALEYLQGPLRSNANVEVVAFNVAAVDGRSVIHGTNAKLGIFLAHGLATDNVTLGYRIFSQGRVETRAMIQGSAMQWTGTGDHQYGSAEIVVPIAAVLHCYASYSGMAQHFWWVSDPETVQNPKRAVYNLFDNKLEILSDFLSKAGGKGRDARDLEFGVAWLLWMLGFSVAHLGGTDKTQDAADLIATTPAGHFAVIECTTGLLKADNKLPLLVERTARVRRVVDASNNKHVRVLSVMVTSRTRDEIKADVEQAEKLGILVISRENLEQAVINTLVLPNAEQLYEQAIQAVESAITQSSIQITPEISALLI